jgi:hypothetical protein
LAVDEARNARKPGQRVRLMTLDAQKLMGCDAFGCGF